MAKVYLFRKLSALNQQQLNVCDEAITSVLDEVIKGKTSTIFSYGDWPNYKTLDEHKLAHKQDMLQSILSKLFHGMEANMQIRLSIQHSQLNIGQNPWTHNADSRAGQFVATIQEVYLYMEAYMKQQIEQQRMERSDSNLYGYMCFTIFVSQWNAERLGKLQLIHLLSMEHATQPIKQSNSPMGNLFKILSILANNEKTHLRYHNIRLTHILKDLMGEADTTVIINYTNKPQQMQLNAATANSCAKIWKALYMRERRKCECLNEKIFSLEFWSSGGRILKLDELVEMLQNSNSGTQLALNVKYSVKSQQQLQPGKSQGLPATCSTGNKQFGIEEQRQLFEEVQQVKLDAEVTYEEMLELQQIVAELAINFEQNVQQLEHKHNKLTRVQRLLAKANRQMQRQGANFQRKLLIYSDMFKSLWRHQRTVMQMKEQQREEQLTEMFDTICSELHSSRHLDGDGDGLA